MLDLLSDLSILCNDCYECYCDTCYVPFVTIILVTDALQLICYLDNSNCQSCMISYAIIFAFCLTMCVIARGKMTSFNIVLDAENIYLLCVL